MPPTHGPETAPPDYETLLHAEVGRYYDDPLGFVLAMFPWGEPGPLEHHSEPDIWQREFLEAIGAEVQARAFDGHTAVAPVRFGVSSGHGIGKALSVTTQVPTPSGWRVFGSLQAGDVVFAEDGTATGVTGVYPQGRRPLYRVVFDDGCSVEADADHLWKVRGRRQRRRGCADWQCCTTAQLMAAGVRRRNGATTARQWEIPQQGAVQFHRKALPIHPYTLGVWLGDGARLKSIVTTGDPEVVARLRAVGERVTSHKRMAWHVSGLTRKLKALGIGAAYSYEKTVPRIYMENGIEERAELLRGLLDTDGECGLRGAVTFSSCSRQLAEAVIELARSLGGKARMQPTVKRGAYRDADGRRVECRDCWRATVTMPPGFQCFYIARKQERITRVQPRYLSRWIDRIEPIGEADAVCITVQHPSRCFLANDFVVTHNSVEVALLVNWIMATRPHCQGTVTANTITQLQTKTWAALTRWTRLCKTGHWFTINADRMYRTGFKESWFCAPQSSKEENSEAFAGQHAADSTSFYVFDEASAIPEAIYQVAEGGLTDGEPMMFLFGNPTRSDGSFHQAVFGSMRHRWHPLVIDSRTSKFTNKEQIAEWVQDYGEDSDFVRVRVRGLPPAASDLQFIDTATIAAAQRREPHVLPDEPLVCGLDVARGGGDDCVFRFRRGTDARSIPPVRIPGAEARDSMRLVSKATDVLSRSYDGQQVAMLFVDGTGIGGPIVDRLIQLGHTNVVEVQFGGEAPDRKYANMRAFMWGRLRDWLRAGAIPADPRLEQDLSGPGYGHDKQDRLVLESKEHMKARGVGSPDDGDALALTFAHPVRLSAVETPQPYRPRSMWG